MRRLLAAGAAILLAALGAMVLVTYVRSADQRANARAISGIQTVPVLVATGPIAKDTGADKLGPLVTVKQLPRMAVVDGAVADLGELAGKVATVDIQPGEQLLRTRFGDPSSAQGDIKVPAGTEQVSIVLDKQRVVGGLITLGAHVGVYRKGKLLADNVLVTHLSAYADPTSSANTATSPKSDATDKTQTSAGQTMVTLALTPDQIAAFVDAAGPPSPPNEIWLSLDKADTPDAH